MTKKTNAAAVAATYARDAVSDPMFALKGAIAAETEIARPIAFASLAKLGGANSADGVNVKAVKRGLRALGVADSACPTFKPNDSARSRAFFYVLNDPDAAEKLAGHNIATIEQLGKTLAKLEKQAQLDAEANESDPVAPTLDGAIAALKKQIKDKMERATAKLGEAARLSQSDFRVAKSLGIPGHTVFDPAKPVDPAPQTETAPQADADAAPKTVDPAPQADAKPQADADAKPQADAAPSDKREHGRGDVRVNPERDRLADIMSAIVAALDAEPTSMKGGILLPISSGPRAADIKKRIAAAFKAANC